MNSCEQPAGPGSVIAVFLHGVGITNAAPPEGTVQSAPLAPLNLPVEASVNGFPVEVVFAGGSAGQAAGLWQVNVRIPEGLTGGALIRVRVAGRAVRPAQVLAWVGP